MELRYSGRAREVPHGDLLVRGSLLQQDERRQKAVHSLEKRNSLRRPDLHYLKRTSRIGRSVMGHHTAERVGDTRLETFERRVLAFGTNAGDELMIRCQRQQPFEIFGRRLQVGVDIAHERRLGVVDARLDGRAQTRIAFESEVMEIAVAPACLLQQRQTVIRRTVVDKQNACAAACSRQVATESLFEAGDVLSLVINGNDNRKVVFGSAIHHERGYLSDNGL